MTDYFALLDQPRQPWLDAAAVKEKYHKLARQNQPDENLNQAYRVLVDPKSRLQHLLALEDATPSSSSEQIPPELIELFMAIAPALNKINTKEPGNVDELIARINKACSQTMKELRQLDANWREKLVEIEILFRRISYLTRWQALLEERRFQLSI